MNLDVITALFVSGIIIAGIGLATLLYSLAKKANLPLLWAAAACAGYSVCMFLAALRGRIPDFLSIVLCNELLLFYMVAYFEAFHRLFTAPPKERFIGPLLLVVQFILFVWYTYYQPDFQVRVVVLSVTLCIMCLCILKLLFTEIKRSRRIALVFTVIPFATLFSISMAHILLFLLGKELFAASFTSPAYAFSIVAECVCAVWITLSVLFIITYRLQTQVVHMSQTDPLTGTMNRRALEHTVEREIARSKRKGTHISLIMADIDHFKRVNDTYGHQAGDAMLIHTAANYKKHLRAEDVLARYGGDELVALLPETDSTQARNVAERLRAANKLTPLVFENRTIPATSSFGVVGCDYPDDYDTLLKYADDALYQAKEAGRDRVVVVQVPRKVEKEPVSGANMDGVPLAGKPPGDLEPA